MRKAVEIDGKTVEIEFTKTTTGPYCEKCFGESNESLEAFVFDKGLPAGYDDCCKCGEVAAWFYYASFEAKVSRTLSVLLRKIKEQRDEIGFLLETLDERRMK